MSSSLTGGGGSGSPFNINPLAPPSWLSNNGANGGYPGVDQRNQFIQSVADPTAPSNYSTVPWYNSLATPPGYVPSPLWGASRTSYMATNPGQQTAMTDALGGSNLPSVGDQFMQQAIAALNSQTGGGPSDSDLRNQANQQAALKYDPLIQALQQNLGSAKTNSVEASKKVGDLYGGLARALAAQMPVITNQFKAAEDQSKQNYANLTNQINSNYQGAQDAQAAELQRLNIQAALPQSTQQLNADRQYLGNQAANNGQSIDDALRLMGQGESDFAHRASIIAPQQGANLQADLASKLNDLQNQINQQIAGYKGQEAASAADLFSQLQSSASKSAASQQQANFENIIKMAQLEKLTHPDAFSGAPKPPTSDYKGIGGVGSYIADNSKVADPNELMSDFMGFAQSKDYAGLTGPGGIGEPSLETAWQGLQQYVRQNDPSITPAGLQELYNALAIKYGKYS